MIEALSTMLDAAVGRDGRSQAPLSEELKYVDAYLYITKERLGELLTVSREIEKSMLGCQIPRLMHSSNTNLQPESIFFLIADSIYWVTRTQRLNLLKSNAAIRGWLTVFQSDI